MVPELHQSVPSPSSILMYHSVCDTCPARDFASYVVTPATLERHLAGLSESGYLMRALSEHMNAAHGRGTVTPPSVCLTFDDGFRDFLTGVMPLLQQYGAHASLFVPTGYVGGTARWLAPEGEADRPILGWAELKDIAASGLVEIGAHSHAHPPLDVVDAARCRSEIALPKLILEDRLQIEIRTFAYPFGYHAARARRSVANAGYQWAVEVGERYVTDADRPLALPRWTVERDTSAERLLRRVQSSPTRLSRPVSAAKRHVWRAQRGLTRAPVAQSVPLPLTARLGAESSRPDPKAGAP